MVNKPKSFNVLIDLNNLAFNLDFKFKLLAVLDLPLAANLIKIRPSFLLTRFGNNIETN